MKVKDLKKILAGMDDEAIIVVEGSDHSYTLIRWVTEKTAVGPSDSDLYEDYGDEHKTDPTDERFKIVLFDVG
jgi:hypothetical protein